MKQSNNNLFLGVVLAFSVVALGLSVYATYTTAYSPQCKGSCLEADDDAFNAKVEKGIEAYAKKMQAQAAQPPAPADPIEVSLDDDPVLGDADAPVTIVEFSDFQCPYCGRHFSQTLQQIIKDYVDTGKAKYVFRDYPLGFHPNARPAAMAADCVREKGGDEAFFEYHDVLFSNQQSLEADNLKKFASDLGYDIADCLDSEKYGDEVDADMNEGSSYGVRGTPATFVNGRLISGAQPYEAFKAVIEEELAK